MKPSARKRIFAAGVFLTAALLAQSQSYNIDWCKIAGGGGASSSGSCTITGAIGQPDASPALSGGNYSLTGGFWSIVSAVQTPGAPSLSITLSGKNAVVYWPNVSGFILQQNNNLASTNWTTSRYSVTTTNGTNSITISAPAGSLFFRLAP